MDVNNRIRGSEATRFVPRLVLPFGTSRVELTRSRGSSVWSRQEAKLGDNLLSYLTMPPLSTPYGAVAAYRSISRQPYKVYWKILQHLQHNSRRGHCT